MLLGVKITDLKVATSRTRRQSSLTSIIVFNKVRLFMQRRSVLCFCGAALAMCLTASKLTVGAEATPVLSDVDRSFMAMVSQGGMYEVTASKVAAEKAARQDITDIGSTEVHDHQLVGAKLRGIASSAGVNLPTALNADFSGRVERLRSMSGKAFDNYYLQEMDAIHQADGAAFAKEAEGGTNPDLRAFAAETVLIVKRHLGSIHALPLKKV